MSAIFYASQQGTAKGIAEKIGEQTGIQVIDAKDVKPEDVLKYTKVVFVVSSYGRGVAPADYKGWWETFNAFSGSFGSVSFAVFGVGNSGYARSFVGFAKTVEAKMIALGAKKICDMGISDDSEERSTDMNEFVQALK